MSSIQSQGLTPSLIIIWLTFNRPRDMLQLKVSNYMWYRSTGLLKQESAYNMYLDLRSMWKIFSSFVLSARPRHSRDLAENQYLPQELLFELNSYHAQVMWCPPLPTQEFWWKMDQRKISFSWPFHWEGRTMAAKDAPWRRRRLM